MSTYADVVTYTLRRITSRENVDDVVAATYLTAWQRLDDVVGANIPVAWLYRVAAGHLANQRRSDRRLAALRVRLFSLPPPPRSDDPADTAVSETGADSVLAALATLSTGDQELLRLAGFEELSPGEIAEAWGVPSRFVRVRLHRARRRLQATLDLQAETSTSRHEVKRTPAGENRETTTPSGSSPEDRQRRER